MDSNETGNINPITFNSGRFNWLSDFNLFQRFVAEILNLKGRWTVPRAGCRQLKTEEITIRLYDNQSVVLEGGELNEYKEFLRKIAGIKPNSVSNVGDDEFELTPTQKASLQNINQYMLNTVLTGVELLDLGITGVNSTTSQSESDLANNSLQDYEGNALSDEENGLYNVVKRLDSLTYQFERHRNETSVVLNELVNIYEDQKRRAGIDQLTQENRLLKEANKVFKQSYLNVKKR